MKDLPGPKYKDFLFKTWCERPEIGYCQISQLLITLGHMLLHNSYMNVMIVPILVYQNRLQDIPGPKCKIYSKCNLVAYK